MIHFSLRIVRHIWLWAVFGWGHLSLDMTMADADILSEGTEYTDTVTLGSLVLVNQSIGVASSVGG